MLETAPVVTAVVDYLRKLQTPKAPKLLAVEAKRHRLALSMAVKLTPMASAEERRQLHRLLMPAYPTLAERPCLEQLWITARAETPPGSATRAFLEELYRTILGEDGVLSPQLVRQVAEALSIDVVDKVLSLLAEVVGTEAEPTLPVADIKMSPDVVRDFGCLWIAEACHRVKRGEQPAAARAIQQAAGHRRYAPRTYLIAGRALLRWVTKHGQQPTLVKNAEACLLNGERVAVRDERPPLLTELVELYRMTGQTETMEQWKKQLGGGRPVPVPTAPAAPVEHSLKQMAPYPALFPEKPPIVLTTSGDEWLLTDYHCPDPKCECGRLFVKIQAARKDCRAVFSVFGPQLTNVSDEAACEHVEDLAALLKPFITGPNEVRLLVQRGRDVKALARAGRWELQQAVKRAELMVHFDDELKSWLGERPYALVSVADWLALLRTRDIEGTMSWQQLLKSRGFGLEPDAGSGVSATPPPPGLAIFPLPSRAATDYTCSPSAWPAFVLARRGMAVLHELGIDAQLYESRLQGLCMRDGLSSEDRLRVQATCALYARWGPSSRTANRGLDRVTADDRAWVARALVELLHDQANRPDVVKRLGKVYALLGVDPHAVFSALHEAGTAAARTGEGLDTKLVQARLQETRQVEQLLEGIFAEETAPVVVSKGLLPGHQTLLRRLMENDSWSREAFVALASEVGLPPDGALDTINDTSLDRFEELALEGDDPIYVTREIVEQLLTTP